MHYYNGIIFLIVRQILVFETKLYNFSLINYVVM